MDAYNPRPLSELIDPGWARALAPVEDRVHRIGEELARAAASGTGYLPAGTDVLLSLICISEPTTRTPFSYAVFFLKKKIIKRSTSKEALQQVAAR